MRTLFFRIFISFWLAMAAILTAAIAVTATVAWYRITMLSGIHPTELLKAATAALRDQGAPGLRGWLAEVTRAHPDLDIYVVNDGGQDVLGRPLPERIAQWLVLDGRSMRGVDGSRNGHYWPFGYDWAPGGITLSHGLGYNGSHLLANPKFAGPDGASYTLLVAWFGATPVDVLGSYNVTLLLCLIALGASAVVCWWLARYISTPVAKLQAGAQTLASGRLDVQLDARICQRRDEFGLLAQEFNHMADRLRSHMASKEMLLRDISHELRSPLARLRVAIGLVQRDDCQQGMHLERMEREIERLDALIGQTLQLSRLSDAIPDFIPETVDIDTLLHEVVEDARMEADATGAQIYLSTNSASCVQGNPELLRRAVENVLRNAVRFAPAGSSIDVSCRIVHDGDVLVSVRDAGRGVPEPHLGRIFEAFYRVAEARSRDDGGTGLGLAITARIMMLHGGHATARNHPDGGLVVELYLPGMAGQSGAAR
jgi:two-component system OmpR family sensor kinase